MSNRINPYRASVEAFRPVAPRREATPPEAAPPAAKAAPATGLSAAEQAAIEKLFPPSEAMQVRVYGAHREARTMNPHALGTRLDLRG